MKKTNYKNSKLVLFAVLLCLMISVFAFSASALADINTVDTAITDVVKYYENRNDGTLTDWWEWLGAYSCTNDLSKFVPADTNTDSEVGTIIAKLIRGKDVTLEATDVAAKIKAGKTYITANDLAWAMIAVDAAKRGPEAVSVDYDTDDALAALAKFATWQTSDGGFNFANDRAGVGEVDITAVVAIAIAPYKTSQTDLVTKITTFFSTEQNADGSYSSADGSWGSGSPNANSTAMAICALASLGIDPNTYYYTDKNTGLTDKTPVTALLGYQASDGGFKYLSTDATSNAYATKQAALALGDLKNSRCLLNTLQKNPTEYFNVTLRIDNGTDVPLLVKRIVKEDTTLEAAAQAVLSGFISTDRSFYLNGVAATAGTKITSDNANILIVPSSITKFADFNVQNATIDMNSPLLLTITTKTVVDGTEDFLKKAPVTINGVAIGYYDKTNDSGQYTISFMEAGTYIVSANAAGVEKPYCKIVVKPASAYSAQVSVRVEGKNDKIIYEPNLVVKSDGSFVVSAMDAFSQAMGNIQFSASGGYVSSIDGLGSDYPASNYGWMYLCNGASPSVSMSNTVLKNGDEIVLYYGDYNTLSPVVTTAKQANGDLKITFTASYEDWSTGSKVIKSTFISGATVKWNGSVLGSLTDVDGSVTIVNPVAGRYTLQIEKIVDSKPTIVRLADDYTVNIAKTVAANDTTKTLADATTPVDLVLPSNVSTANIVASGVAAGVATLPAINVTSEQASGSALSMDIASGTVVTSADATWNGTIQVPTITTASVTGQTVQKAISAGVSGQTLNFDKPVRLVIPGAATYKVGFIKKDGSIQEITTTLTNDNLNAATAALTGSVNEAKIVVGSDMVIWTKHFTTFAAYTTPASGGGTVEQVFISVVDPNGTTYKTKTAYTFENGMTALSLLQKTGLSVKVSSTYVSSIAGLAEKKSGYPNSGWMYKVGSKFPTTASSSYKLSAGDDVQWIYSLDLGADVGDNYMGGDTTVTTPTNGIPVATKAIFIDVPTTHWAANYISYLADKKVIEGKTATTYEPSSNITRAEFVTILARMSGADLTKYTTASYSDIKANAWYIAAIAWATEVGVTSGSDGKFNPSSNISREEMAAMISRYAEKVAKYTLPKANTAVTFADNNEVSSYAKDAVSLMQQAGIIDGIGDNKFAPKDAATRGAAAKMLAVLLQDIKGVTK